MTEYLLDSNALSALFRKKPSKELLEKIRSTLNTDNNIFMSGISYYEIKRGLVTIHAGAELNKFNNLCNTCRIIWLDDQSIFDEAALIYSKLKIKGRLISDADILIGATAIIKNMTIVSDDADFKNIENLKFLKTQEWIKEK